MSLSKLRSDLRPKLNSSFNTDQTNEPSNIVQEIKQLKENFDSLRTPKLYQKIMLQYKANLKNRRLADAMSSRNGSKKSDFYGSMDILSALKESHRGHDTHQDHSHHYDDESIYSNKENLLNYSVKRPELKYTSELGVQTSPKIDVATEEMVKLKMECENQNKIVKVMEEDLSKIRIENIKLDRALKAAQENLAVLGKNQNNTSSSFSLPSEFKTNWEMLAKDQIINVYSDFIDNPIIITNLLQEIIIICYDQAKNVIKEVNCNVLKTLNLNNEKNETAIKKHLVNFYQDNYATIFKLDETRLEKIKGLYKKYAEKVFTHIYTSELANFSPENDEPDTPQLPSQVAVNMHSKPSEQPKPQEEGQDDQNSAKEEVEVNVSSIEKDEEEEENKFKVEIREEYQEQFDDMVEMEDFSKLVNSVFYLCLFMLLSDPVLKVPIENFKNRKFVYKRFKKNDFICVDGFAKESSPCLVLLPPVTRNNHPYNGIKPSVLILQDEFMTPKILKTLEQSDKEEQEKLSKKQEKEAQEEKLMQTEKNPVKAMSISMEEKCYPHSLNTTANIADQHTNANTHIMSKSSTLIHSDLVNSSKNDDKTIKIDKSDDNSELYFTLSKNTKPESSSMNQRLFDNSKENDDSFSHDVTARPSKAPKASMLLQREDGDENAHNTTISMFLTERQQQREEDTRATTEFIRTQDLISSSRDASRMRKYPLPPNSSMENQLKRRQETGRRSNKSLVIKPLSMRINEQENKPYLGDSLRQRMSDIYDVIQPSETVQRDVRETRPSHMSENALKNSSSYSHLNFRRKRILYSLLNQSLASEENKGEDYSVNSFSTQRTTDRSRLPNNNVSYRGASNYKGIVTELSSSRGASSNSRAPKPSKKDDSSQRDNSASRDYRSNEKVGFRTDELREKIRKSFLTTRVNQSGTSESYTTSKLDDQSSVLNTRPSHQDHVSRTRDSIEHNNTISSLKKSIEMLKNGKIYNDKIKNKFHDSYERVNTSLVGRGSRQSEPFSGSILKHLDGDSVDMESSLKKSDGIISKIVAEKMKLMEKKFQFRPPSCEGNKENTRKDMPGGEGESNRSPQLLSHEYIKQKLNKLSAGGRSISTNRGGDAVMYKNEDDSLLCANDSFRKDGGMPNKMMRIGSVNKLSNRDRTGVKEMEENVHIFKALRNIYQKN